jgi:ABC-type antimicrobial peptide transport system permease subunit
MSKIFSSIIFRRKKYSIMGILICLSMILMLAVSFILDSSKDRIYSYYESKYARFHLSSHQVSSGTIKRLDRFPSVEAGIFKSYGVFRTSTETRVTLGSYDDKARELGCFQFLSGSWPDDESEIVLDESTARFGFDSEVITGDTITLQNSDHTVTYVISGIVKDFRGIWNDSPVIIVPGYNDYPNAIIIDGSDSEITDTGIMIYSLKDGFDGDGIGECLGVYYTVTDVAGYDHNIAMNNNLYVFVRDEIFGQFLTFQKAIIIIIYLSTVAVFYILIRNILDDYMPSIRKYRNLGTSKAYLTFQINAEFLVVYMISSMLPILANCFVRKTGFIYYYVFCTVIFFIIANYVIHFRLKPSYTYNKRASKDILSPEKSVIRMIYSIFARSNVRKVIISLLILSSIISCFFISSFHMQDVKTLFDVGTNDFSFTIAGYFDTVKGLAYSERQFTGAPYELAADLLSLDGIDSYELFLEGPLGGPVYKKDSLYWKALTIYDSSDMENARQLAGYDDYIYGVTYTDTVIVDDYNIYLLLKYYPDLPVADMKRKGSITLALPDVTYGSDILTDDLYHEGDMFPFGALTTHDEQPANVVDITGKDLKYVETGLKIEKIFKSTSIPELSIRDNYAIVFMTADTLESLERGLLCVSLDIHLSSDISEDQYQRIEESFFKLRTSSSDSYFFSKRDTVRDMTDLINTINTALALLMAVLGVFSVISVYMVLHMSLMEHRHMVGITMSQGLTARKISASIYLESLTYTGMMVLISIVITFYAFHKIWIINNINQPRFFPVLILMGTVYLFVLIVIPVFLSLVFRRRIHKTEISDFIRYRE